MQNYNLLLVVCCVHHKVSLALQYPHREDVYLMDLEKKSLHLFPRDTIDPISASPPRGPLLTVFIDSTPAFF